MAVEKSEDGTITITGNDIGWARILVLRAALRLEVKGFNRSGRSVFSILKGEGIIPKTIKTKKAGLEWLNEAIDAAQDRQLAEWANNTTPDNANTDNNSTNIENGS